MDTIGSSRPTKLLVALGAMTDATSGAWPEVRARYDTLRIR
ncbi:MAG: hypothetical protein JWP87_293 [Labilithrix sp.]|nr:hypothetical protein [Labilithrix sp.]